MRIAVVPTTEIREQTFRTIDDARAAIAPPATGMSVVLVIADEVAGDGVVATLAAFCGIELPKGDTDA